MTRMGSVLLLLPALVLLLASGLQLESAGDQERKSAPLAANRSVLLIVAGLSRHYETAWPRIERSLLLPNEAAGYNFRIVFSTDAGLECHPSSPKWTQRKCEEPTDQIDQNSHLQDIKKAFAPRAVEVRDARDVCGTQHTRLRSNDTGDPADGMTLDDESAPCEVGSEVGPDDGHDTGARLRRRACAPWFSRVHRVLADVVESGERFDRVVALRPDIDLFWAPGADRRGEGGPPQLLLDRMCAERPGFSFVTPTWTIHHRSWLHNRDLDFMHILCPGEKLPVYEKSIRNLFTWCKTREPFPAVPPGFKSTKGWTNAGMFCRFVQVLNTSDIPIAHWDDSYHADFVNVA